MLVRIILPPEIEPVTVAELKEYLHVDCDSEDTLLSQLIKAARKMAEEYQHRAYMQQTLEAVLEGGNVIELPRSEFFQEIVSVADTKGHVTDYTIEPGLNYKLYFEKAIQGQVTVRYVTGLSDPKRLEETVCLAIMMLASNWYENRLPVTDGKTVTDMPFSVKALLAPGEVVTL